MATEPITGQTYQEAGSLQTDALQNAQLDYFAAWLNCVVLSVGDTAPPGSPTNGDRYIVGASATGEWATHDDALAVHRDGWQFYAPTAGVWVKDLATGDDYEFVGSGPAWTVKAGGASDADGISYDNSTSGLSATDVQAAIDELEAMGGGGGGGGPWSIAFRPVDNEPPTSNYATLDTRNNRPVLDFDTTTQEAAIFTGVMPNGYAGGGLTVTIFCALTSATSGTVGWDVAFERTQASTDDIDSDSFATAQTVTAVTVPGTSGHVLAMSVNVANGADMDSIAAGELFRLRVRRDVATDTATGDAELLAVSIKEQ